VVVLDEIEENTQVAKKGAFRRAYLAGFGPAGSVAEICREHRISQITFFILEEEIIGTGPDGAARASGTKKL
jgi:hypothetical protein